MITSVDGVKILNERHQFPFQQSIQLLCILEVPFGGHFLIHESIAFLYEL